METWALGWKDMGIWAWFCPFQARLVSGVDSPASMPPPPPTRLFKFVIRGSMPNEVDVNINRFDFRAHYYEIGLSPWLFGSLR